MHHCGGGGGGHVHMEMDADVGARAKGKEQMCVYQEQKARALKGTTTTAGNKRIEIVPWSGSGS